VVVDPNSPLATYGRVPASTGVFDWPGGFPWSPRILTPQSPGCFGWGRVRLLDDPNLLAQNGPGAPARANAPPPLEEPARGSLASVPTTLHGSIVFAQPSGTVQLFQNPAKGQQAVPLPEDVIQGYVGNCPVASTLMALAHTPKGQEKIAGKLPKPGMILDTQTTVTSKNPAGGALLTTGRLFTVTFPQGTSPVKITDFLYQSSTAPVEMIFMHADQNPAGGVFWPSLLEKAYVMFKSKVGSESYQVLDGPNVQEVMNDLWGDHVYVNWDTTTGEVSSQVVPGSCTSTGCSYGGGTTFDLKDPKKVQAFQRKVQALLTNHAALPTVAGAETTSGNIEGPHLYAVIGFGTNQVTVLNPNRNANNSPPRQVVLSFADFLTKFTFLLQGV
jgi:hypothetical protein